MSGGVALLALRCLGLLEEERAEPVPARVGQLPACECDLNLWR